MPFLIVVTIVLLIFGFQFFFHSFPARINGLARLIEEHGYDFYRQSGIKHGLEQHLLII